MEYFRLTWRNVFGSPLEDCKIQSKKNLKKFIDNPTSLIHDASMFKSTDHYKIVESDKLEQHLEGELKNILDKLMNPEYVAAVEKLAEICSKQNYLYN